MESREGVAELAERSARAGFALLIGDLSSTALLAASSIVIARLLGPEDYGAYSISFAAPSLIISLVGLGLDLAAVRFPAKYAAEGRGWLALGFIRTVLAFRLATGLAASLACLLLSDVMAGALLSRPGLAPYVRLLSTLVLFQTLFSLLYGLFVGLGSSGGASALKALMASFKAAVAPLLVLLGLGVYGALLGHVAGYAASSVAGLALLYLRYCRRSNRPPGAAGRGCLWEAVKFSMPLYASSLLGLLLGSYQAILLARTSSDAEVGCFRAALNISTIVTVAASPILTALLPAFSRLNPRASREELEQFLNLSVRYSSLVIVPLAALVASTSSQLVDFIYGAGYALAGGYLAFYSATHMLVGLGSGVFWSLFNGVGETGLTLRSSAVNLVAFAAAAPLLAHLYGVFGIIAALLASSLVSTLYAYWLARGRLGVRLSPSASAGVYASSALSAMPTALLALYAGLPSALSLALCSVVYAVSYLTLAPLLGGVGRGDLASLERAFGSSRPLGPLFKLVVRYEYRVLAAYGALRNARRREPALA